MVWFLTLLMTYGGYYFADATIYDVNLGALRIQIHVVIDEDGKVVLVTDKPPNNPEARRIEKAVLLPHLTDFYSLVQERGLGFDIDLDASVQARMHAHLQKVGVGALRDPVFPPGGLEPDVWRGVRILSQRGYLEVKGGPSVHFSIVVDPDQPDAPLNLPETGPITFWWSNLGPEDPVVWPNHPILVRQLIDRFHRAGHKVGAYIQDARPEELKSLYSFPFDFYEGLPAEGVNIEDFPKDVIWVPLAGLNDKRYCAKNFKQRLGRIRNLLLYDQADIAVVEDRLDSIAYRIADRCGVWQKRRDKVLQPVADWIARGGKLGIGSGGGHLFSFTAEIAFELQTLERLGAEQKQLLRSLYSINPGLLGHAQPYLEVGRPANFVVYRQDRFWGRLIEGVVDLNFVNGKQILSRQLRLE